MIKRRGEGNFIRRMQRLCGMRDNKVQSEIDNNGSNMPN